MKKIQKKVKNFYKENNLDSPLEYRLLDTLAELGEVAKEVLKMNDYGRKSTQYRKEFEEELADVLGMIIVNAYLF